MTTSKRWHLWSDQEGVLPQPQPVRRLPKSVLVSGDGNWAERWENERPAQVFLRLDSGRAPTMRRRWKNQ